MPVHVFHSRCGGRVVLNATNTSAHRNPSDFNCGLVFSRQPLTPDQLFEVRIDKKISSWSGSIEMGVTACDPATFDLPSSATDLREGSWIMSGNSILRDGRSVVEVYGRDLDQLGEGDTVGVMRTSQGELEFYVNGQSQGVAAVGLPSRLFAVVDMYGKCAQVSIIQPDESHAVTERQILVPNSDARPITILANRLRFHQRSGALVKLTNGGRTAERRRPLDEFNNGVVMTHRPLKDNELFEIRIDKLVAKWSGSIEAGVTSHNPEELTFPATMTNLRSGTTMMSGCGILTNGQGTRREYGDFNLDELREGDRIGMIRRSNNDLHYLINGMDQGVAAQNKTGPVWGVIDLYGMTVKVTIVDRDEREEQNLKTRRNTTVAEQFLTNAETTDEDCADRLTFHQKCGTHAAVINNGRTAHRPNAVDDFNNGVVLTSRFLHKDELFEVRLDKMVTKWAGSIEIGVTTHNPTELEYPSTMTNVRSGTWMMTGNGVMHNGTTIIDEYGQNLDRLTVGDRVGVMRLGNGTLHFFVNGTDQGVAASGIPEQVYGVIDLYGQAAQASIVSIQELGSSSLMSSVLSNTCMYSDLRFHHSHGRNARISNNGLTASRPRAFGEFNDAIVISNRPLQEGELFEVVVERTVDRWSGSIEAGVTAIRPDDLDFPSTMTDIDHSTWMLSGSSVMQDGATIRNGYKCDLDAVRVGSRIGMMRHSDGTLHYYMNGEDQGVACENIPLHVFAVVDLYGQCAQVSIVQPPAVGQEASVASSHPMASSPLSLLCCGPRHCFSRLCGTNVRLVNHDTEAVRIKHFNHGLVLSGNALVPDQVFEVYISDFAPQWAGSLRIGVTTLQSCIQPLMRDLPASIFDIPEDTWFVVGSQVHRNKSLLKLHFCPSLDWLLPGDRVGVMLTTDYSLRLLVNSEDMGVVVTRLPKNVYAVVDVFGRTKSVKVISEDRAPPGVVGMQLHSGTLAATSPGQTSLRSSRLQDSLELLGVRSPLSPVLPSTLLPPLALPSTQQTSQQEQQQQPLPVPVTNRTLRFHERHGRNIQLDSSRTIAQRTASYNQGLIVGENHLVQNLLFQVRIDRVSKHWTSSLLCGVTAQSPDTMPFPVTALGLKKNTWVICSDGVFHNGIKVRGMYGPDWERIGESHLLGLLLDSKSRLHLFVDGEDQGVAATDIPFPCYPIIDVYGQCEQVTLVGPETALKSRGGSEKEKAELEDDEKGSMSPNYSNAEDHSSNSSTSSHEPSVLLATTNPSAQCDHLQTCLTFKAAIGLPDGFFLGSVECFCAACDNKGRTVISGGSVDERSCDVLEHGDPPNEYWRAKGWCSFALRRPPKPPDAHDSCSNWHIAYCPTDLANLRRILDQSALLMPGEPGMERRCEGRLPKEPLEDSDGTTLVLAPNIKYVDDRALDHNYTDHKTNTKYAVQVALSVLVQPGSYSVHDAADQPNQTWATKERGNTVLSALLLKITPLW